MIDGIADGKVHAGAERSLLAVGIGELAAYLLVFCIVADGAADGAVKRDLAVATPGKRSIGPEAGTTRQSARHGALMYGGGIVEMSRATLNGN